MLAGREWRRVTGATPLAISTLERNAPFTLPDELLELLRFSNGGEGPLPVHPLWFQLYPTEYIYEIERLGTFKEFFEGFFIFGGNGGGEAIAFDLRSPKCAPIISFDMTNINIDESLRPIAPDFTTFLQLIGSEDRSLK